MPGSGPAPTLHALVAHLVDYAGLFPPAALPMRDAVASYAAHLEAPEAWMLGRFVVPATRLTELAEEATPALNGREATWHLAALAGPDVDEDMARIREFNAAHRGRLVVDVVETKTTSPAAVESAASAVGAGITLYAELPVADDPRPLLEAARAMRVRAKVRTGGLTADAFPTAAQVARFIVRCAELGVPWKATAGLHHPLRAEHRLTYDADAPRGTMFGFINVFAAGAFALAGMRESALVRLLEERDPSALEFGDGVLRWRGHDISLDQLAEARASFAIAFGSCSFREPVDDLHQLALL